METQSREDGRARRVRRRRWKRAGFWAVSAAAHLAIPFVLLFPQEAPPPRMEPLPVIVSLAPMPKPPPPEPEPKPAEEPAPPAPKKVAIPLPKRVIKPVPRPPPEVKPLLVAAAVAPEPAPGLSEAEAAGARKAGSGGGGGGSGAGGGCDMVRHLQTALRRDSDVQAALAQANEGRALLVWNGDWVLSRGQEGKGLAGVRQAIALEVAFAPAACRAEAMRGMVLISMADRPGAARLALGSGSWRWNDLLGGRR